MYPKIDQKSPIWAPGWGYQVEVPKMSEALNHSEIVSETSPGTQKTRKGLNFQMTLKKINFTEGIKKNL